MIKIIKKSKKNRFFIYKTEIKKKLIKAIIGNCNYSNMTRWNSLINMYYFSSISSKTSLIFKFILKGSKRGINKFYRYSRHTFLKLVRFGVISGLKKASW